MIPGGFTERFGLWTEDRARRASLAVVEAEKRGVASVRLAFADQHGILRGKTVTVAELEGVLKNGAFFTTTLLLKDTSHRTVFPVFQAGGGLGQAALQGGADALMLPDPASFRILPWASKTAWMLCDLYFPDGSPVPFSTRHLCQRALGRLNDKGYDLLAGLEVEFHLYKLENANLKPEDAGQPGTPPSVSLLTQGYNYLTEQRYDALEPIYEILRQDIEALGLPLRSMEVEFGPSQCEFTFRPGVNIESADTMVLFRSAVKQIARRHGYHATFMCRPKLPNAFSSGWHLHQSLREKASGTNAFMAAEGGGVFLSPLGQAYLAGLLLHAPASAALAAPTINAYRRYRPNSLAPDRANWGRDNRGVMLRVLGAEMDPASRIENRLGEPAANPYLYLASQVLAGLDGIEKNLAPPPPADAPYETPAEPLPRSLEAALLALGNDACYAEGLGADFIAYYRHIKEAEIARFNLEVSDWEQREYFELF